MLHLSKSVPVRFYHGGCMSGKPRRRENGGQSSTSPPGFNSDSKAAAPIARLAIHSTLKREG
jgi:hypothetical protein